MPVERLEINRYGIATLVKEGRLAVPRNQREYAWKDDNVTDLCQDVTKAIHDKEPDYFLGSLVVAKSPQGTLHVFDGQQRLATTVILLAAIRDWYSLNGDPERAKIVNDQYLTGQVLKTLDKVQKLTLGKVDNDFFAKRVLAESETARAAVKPTSESHRRIDAAVKIAAKHIAGLVATLPEGSRGATLNEWVEFLSEKAMVICVQVPDDATAYVVFETMNDRGLRPSAADLLKNHIYGIAEDRADEAEQGWVKMMGALETVPDAQEDIGVTYVRHLWISQHGPTRTKALFDNIKREVKSKQAAVDLSNALATGATLYSAMLNPAHDKWNPYGASAKKDISTLQSLGVEQIRPLLLAAISKFSIPETTKLLKASVYWTVRFLISGTIGGGALESEYGRRALEIHQGKLTTTDAVATALAGIIPRDDAFRSAFSVATVAKSNLARYYLMALQRKQDGEAEAQYVPNDNGDVNLEHILPESPSADWRLTEDVMKANWKRIGNLALLQATENKLIGNESYALKKPVLAKSKFSLTQSASAYAEWGVAEIAKRQGELADVAVKTWPLKP